LQNSATASSDELPSEQSKIWYVLRLILVALRLRLSSILILAPGSGAKPPSHYICNRCEKPGHWKKDCPTMGDPAFDERKFAVGVPICRTRVLADQSGAGAGLDVMRLPDGRLVQCVPAEYVLFTPSTLKVCTPFLLVAFKVNKILSSLALLLIIVKWRIEKLKEFVLEDFGYLVSTDNFKII
jgi:hypothetical protein